MIGPAEAVAAYELGAVADFAAAAAVALAATQEVELEKVWIAVGSAVVENC